MNKKWTELSSVLRISMCLSAPAYNAFVSYQFFLGQTTSHLPVFTAQANKFHWPSHAANHQPHSLTFCFPDLSLLTYFPT